MSEQVEQQLAQLLANLRLKSFAERMKEMVEAAEKAGTPVMTLLAQLFRVEWEARQEKALESRLKRAALPEEWTLESFPFKVQTGVKERQIRTLAELAFIRNAENIVFIGETGVGKSGLMSALVLKAVQNGHRARFVKAQDLFDDMYASLADRSTRNLVRSLASVDVLAIDSC